MRLLGCSLLAFFVSGCYSSIAGDVAANILAVEGSVLCKHPHQQKNNALANAGSIRAGDTVFLNDGARLSAALLPNLLVEIRGAAELRIDKLALTKDGNETGEQSIRQRIAHLHFQRGVIVASHERRDVAAEPDFAIETPFGTVTTNYDSLFILDVNGDRSRLTALTGYVSFAPPKKTHISLDVGSVGEWTAEKSVRSTAESDPNAQRMIVDALESERQLRALRDKKRGIFPGK